MMSNYIHVHMAVSLKFPNLCQHLSSLNMPAVTEELIINVT